jgi:4-amino-4-deoxy-L-arabinose transferase-like glycosyltransferase
MRYLTSAPGIITLVTILFLAPFLNKAFHIDDPLFIWSAQQIQKNPLDPFGFQLNWNDVPEYMWQVTKNPPLACYYVAAVGSFVGYGELPLHLAFLLPACLVTAGTYVLAKRFVQRPLWPAFLALITPAFWVSATNVMCDVWLTAFCVWATILWFKARDKENPLYYAATGLIIALAALSKYYGVVLLAPLFLNVVLRRPRSLGWLLTFVIPLAVLVGYEVWTANLYGKGLQGRGLIREAMAWSAQWGPHFQPDRPFNAVIALTYLGGCVLPILFLAPWMFSRRGLIACGSLALVFMVAGQLFSLKDAKLDQNVVWALPEVWIQGPFFAFAAVCGLAAAVKLARHSQQSEGGSDAWVLISWVLLTFIFVAFFNWTVNARVMLPMVPQLAILCQLAMEKRVAPPSALSRQKYAACVAPAVVLSLIVVHADYQFANANRTMAYELQERQHAPLTNMAFTSHWGFQYYMQQLGAQPINSQRLAFFTGQGIVEPAMGTFNFKIFDPNYPSATHIQIPRFSLASTFGEHEGYYLSSTRALPYSYRIVRTEDFTLNWVK